MPLNSKNAVVTGGGSGIGRAICLRLASEGLDVAVLDINQDSAQRVGQEVAALGRRTVAATVDVAEGPAVLTAVDLVHSALGPVQILVNCAGLGSFAPFLQMTDEHWDRTIATHLRGTFLCCRAFLPDMVAAGWGRVVNVASVAGLTGGGPALAHYAAAKGGIIALTKTLALEFGRQGITANVIAPGLIDTPGLRASGINQQIIDIAVKQAPIPHVGTPNDVAAACAYLVSEQAAYFTGQIMSPNGGVHM
jgi:2-hydroxycyclohexanecarboxyl-CoA dehydrogenase